MPMLKKIAYTISYKSRLSKLDQFYAYYKSGRVLDVGVTSGNNAKGSNIFLKSFRYSSGQYTGLGVENLDEVSQNYPDKKFVQYDGRIFPFDDNEFDWVFSNAVIEHVGKSSSQLLFLNEMLRVGRNVFFTTPNKYFPVESHTRVLFLHWFDGPFYRWCSRNRPLLNEESLSLLSYGDIEKLLEHSNAEQYNIRCNRFLGMTMTYTVVCSDGKLSTPAP